MAKIVNSLDIHALYLRMVLYGPPGMGKTSKAVSISEKTSGYLDDVLIVNFDGNGTGSLKDMGLSVPTIDLSLCHTADKLKSEMADVVAQLPELIKKGLKAVIFDTVSSYNDALELAFSRVLSGYDIYRARMNANEQLIAACLALPVHAVFVSHAKALKEGSEEAAKRAATFVGTSRIAMDVGGQAADPYKRHADLIMAMPEPKMNKGVLDRYLICKPGNHGYEVKSKYSCLDEKEYGSLQNIIKKIRLGKSAGGNPS